jgi:DNA repair exonuclease SbcCD nuclease subunit
VLLAHLSDLHLGHRAYDRSEGGRNVRERDVAAAFQRAVQEVIRLKPDLIFLVGDIFDRPDPPPGALVELARGLETLRSTIPSTQIFMVAGARDTPRPMSAPGALAALDPFPQVEAVTGTARSIFLRDMETHLYLVPHGAVVRRPYPELRTHPDARWNLLLAYAGVGTGAGPGLPLDPRPWDYIALGHLHQHQKVAPNTFYSGSLERVGPEPWREAAQEKGFLTFDLEKGVSRFHPIPGRPVVALAPIRIPHGESAHLAARVREVLAEVPGGIDGKIVRLRIEGLSPQEVKQQDKGLFSPLWNQALHLAIEVDDFQNLGDENPLPLVSRDRGFALRALREQIRSGGGEEVMALLGGIVGDPSPSGDPPGLEEELLLREVHGSDLPFLGNMGMEAQEGLLAWMGGDGRTLTAFASTLLWGVGITSELPGSPQGESDQPEPTVAVRLGIRGGSFWRRNGPSGTGIPIGGGGEVCPEWGLPPDGVALAWCGAGGETPEDLLKKGAELLAVARGVDGLTSLKEELVALHPGLRKGRSWGELSARDYERLRLESELADLRTQLRALEDVPARVTGLELGLRELRASQAEHTGDVEGATMDWHRERQDAETHLHAYRDRGRELKERLQKLETLGPESPCPTCGRLLEVHAQKVLEGLREEWEGLVQDGQWWRRRWEQLESKPDGLKELEGTSVRLHAEFEDKTERLERARSSLRELDELRDREREVYERWESLNEEEARGEPPGELAEPVDFSVIEALEPPEEVRILYTLARDLAQEILEECRIRLLHRGGRRLNRLTGGRILGLEEKGRAGEVQLVEGGGTAGVEADQDRAAATVALRMALVELISEDWSPLGSFILGDPFDRMGEEDQLRALSLLRRILSRVTQVILLTRGTVVERAPEFFDGLFEFREATAEGLPPLRTLPAGVGVLRIR